MSTSAACAATIWEKKLSYTFYQITEWAHDSMSRLYTCKPFSEIRVDVNISSCLIIIITKCNHVCILISTEKELGFANIIPIGLYHAL